MATTRGAVGVVVSCLLAVACGEAAVTEPESTSQPAGPDGQPDCAGGEPWVAEPGIDLDAPGEPTAEAALRPFLEQWQILFGGDIAMVDADHAALTLDGAEIVVAYTTRTNSGGFAVNGSTGCDGFEPEVLPGPPSSDNPNPATAPSVPATDAVDGPVIRYPERFDSGDEMDALVLGVLELDGDCLYVALGEVGERFPILWPAGTTWDERNQAVISPVGESMAIGDEVSGGGGYLYVDDIERIAGPQASSVAAACVDNTYGEIAVVNNSDGAIGPAQN